MEELAVAVQTNISNETLAELSAPSRAPVQAGGFSYFSQDSEWLPPVDYRLPEYREGVLEKIPTPVDDKGLVLVPGLIAAINSSVSKEYKWPKGRRNESTHHIYYEAEEYPHNRDGGVNPALFRDLTINKIELPKIMHNWLHLVMEEPAQPSEEVMQYCIDAVRAAQSIFASAREVIQWERKGSRRAEYISSNPGVIKRRKPTEPEGDYIFIDFLAELIDKQFYGVETHLSKLQEVPPEFRIVEPRDTPVELAAEIGRFVVPRSLKVGRLVHQSEPSLIAA
jgi:hypothetical protein